MVLGRREWVGIRWVERRREVRGVRVSGGMVVDVMDSWYWRLWRLRRRLSM